MPIDTVRLISPSLNPEQVKALEYRCIRREGVELASGEIAYSFTGGSLRGSWDNSISIQIRRFKYQNNNGTPQQVNCAPFTIIECSLPKALYGHNIYGGQTDPRTACFDFIKSLEISLMTNLPDPNIWEIERIDWSESYVLDPKGIPEYFSAMKNCTFPRRATNTYGNSGIYFSGTTTTLKFYHKGPEFLKHDKKRLMTVFPVEIVFQLQELAYERLRVEVEIKKKMLIDLFGGLPKVSELDPKMLIPVYDREVLKVVKQARSTMKIVRTHRDVRDRLYSVYSATLAARLFQHWCQFAVVGEKEIQSRLTESTFYRVRKQLADAGISWNNTDVLVVANDALIPQDFEPIRSDIRRCVLNDHPSLSIKKFGAA